MEEREELAELVPATDEGARVGRKPEPRAAGVDLLERGVELTGERLELLAPSGRRSRRSGSRAAARPRRAPRAARSDGAALERSAAAAAASKTSTSTSASRTSSPSFASIASAPSARRATCTV